MRIEGVHIAGIGTAATGSVDTAQAVELGWYDPDELDRGGLLSVSVAGATPAPDLAVEAARRALQDSGHAPAEVRALLHTSVHPQGPDGWSAQHYINRNTVNQPAMSVEVRNGCVGLFSSMALAACYLTSAAGPPAVLVTAADNFGTPSVDRWRAAPKLFVLADGGGALVLSRQRGFARLLAVNFVSNPELEVRHRGGESLFPPGLTSGGTLNFAERMEFCRRQAARGEAPPLTDFAAVLIEAVERSLKDADTSLGEIARVVHDGYTRDALRDMYLDPLGVEEERGIWEYTRRVGHAGPVDQVRGLEHLRRTGAVTVGDKVLLVSDAPGMEAASAVLEITEAP